MISSVRESIESFCYLLKDQKIHMENRCFDKVINKFKCYLICEDFDKKEIKEQKNESKIIIIGIIRQKCSLYFVIIFDYTIIFLTNISLLPNLINDFKESTIFTITKDIKSLLPNDFQNQIYEYKEPYETEYFQTVASFSDKFELNTFRNKEIKKIWPYIRPIFSSYFINKSYQKLQKERLKLKFTEISKGNFITLQQIGYGSSSNVHLIYHIEMEQLFAKKIYHNSIYKEKSFKREKYCYECIHHLSFPHFYGIKKIENQECLIIEYIRGTTLNQIDKIKLSDEDKIDIILQLVIIIEYLQYHQFIYRDLKPNNVILDQNHQIILLDFDQMVLIEQNYNITGDFNSLYVCPELRNGEISEYTYKEDVYSIGILIYFIFFHEDPKFERINESDKKSFSFDKFSQYQMKKICEECTETDPKNRPRITKLIDYFFNNFCNKNSNLEQAVENNNKINEILLFPKWISNNNYLHNIFLIKQNETYKQYSIKVNSIHLFFQFELGVAHYVEEYFSTNINKFVEFLSFLSEDSKPNFYLGIIFYTDQYTSRDINRSIGYFIFSANKNDPDAQYYLGYIYYEGKYIRQNINKAIHFYSLAAKQNHQVALFNLGLFYSEGKYITQDIDKAIYYFKLVANTNNPNIQFELGFIYFSGKLIGRDISKAIHYLTLAANQNHPDAQFYLGIIYYDVEKITQEMDQTIHYCTHINCSSKYITRDIEKSINYLTLAANQNHLNAQIYLGQIYLDGKYITRDINKAIHYFTLVANQNKPGWQNILGSIYYEGKYIARDIDKAIHYFTLAANQNYPDSLNYLGLIYYEGKYITQEIDKAIHYFTLAANQNYPKAQNNLGLIYYNSKYIDRDIDKAIHYLTLAANQNFSDAQNNLGMIYYEGKCIIRDIDKAIHYLTLAANQNDPAAQNNLGKIYYEGKYIKQDIDKAINYLTLAANQNEPESQFNLGYIYYEGKYITQDIKKATHYLTLAANKNFSYAQYYLGLLYYEGKYFTQNVNKAINYFSLASCQDNSDASFYLGCFYLNGLCLPKNINSAALYFHRAVMQHHHDSFFFLGIINSKGEYFKIDMRKSIQYYKDASSFNVKYAKNNLAIIYRKGIGIEKNIGYAIELLQESIKLGDYVAMYNLSHIYFYEQNVSVKSLDDIIKMLIISLNSKVYGYPSFNLLCIVLAKKYHNIVITPGKIQHEIKSHGNVYKHKTNELAKNIYTNIKNRKLKNSKYYEQEYQKSRNLNYMYNSDLSLIEASSFIIQKKDEIKRGEPINKEFFLGFGLSVD